MPCLATGGTSKAHNGLYSKMEAKWAIRTGTLAIQELQKSQIFGSYIPKFHNLIMGGWMMRTEA